MVLTVDISGRGAPATAYLVSWTPGLPFRRPSPLCSSRLYLITAASPTALNPPATFEFGALGPFLPSPSSWRPRVLLLLPCALGRGLFLCFCAPGWPNRLCGPRLRAHTLHRVLSLHRTPSLHLGRPCSSGARNRCCYRRVHGGRLQLPGSVPRYTKPSHSAIVLPVYQTCLRLWKASSDVRVLTVISVDRCLSQHFTYEDFSYKKPPSRLSGTHSCLQVYRDGSALFGRAKRGSRPQQAVAGRKARGRRKQAGS